ncbi:hypothetical protein [Flagellimonas marinaquae]
MNKSVPTSMETKQLSKVTTEQKTIQLVDGTFTPSEANDVISALIDEKINFHKIQRLKIYEGNHHCKTNLLDSRIVELEEERRMARMIINQARSEGRNVQINGVLEFKFVD